MRFLPLPHSVVRLVAITTTLLLAWLVWGTFNYPETLWAPGDLSRFHADIADCKSCHQPFRGTEAGKCIACHKKNRFCSPFQAHRIGIPPKTDRRGQAMHGMPYRTSRRVGANYYRRAGKSTWRICIPRHRYSLLQCLSRFQHRFRIPCNAAGQRQLKASDGSG